MKMMRAVGLGVAGWMAWRLFGPEIAPRFPSPQERPTRITGRSVLVGQRELFVREAGSPDADPLILLHGWGYDSLATWHRVIEPLAEHYRVIAIDQRNTGRSERVRGGFDVEDIADEVAAVMDAVGTPRGAVAGWSMGGMVAQALALRHPSRVERLVIGATAAFPLPRMRVPMRVGFLVARALGRITLQEWARFTLAYLVREGAVEPRYARWYWGSLLDRDIRLAFESGAAVWRFDSRSWAGKLDVPTLIIIPSDDQLVAPAAQWELAQLMAGASVLEIVGARHEAILTHADDITKAIADHIG